MDSALVLTVVVLVLIGVGVWWALQRAAERRRRQLDDAKAEARRWVERLGGQVLNLTGTTEAARQALADAAERHTAAGAQMDQASSVEQCRLTTHTALEGLYYVRAARVAMGMDAGPALPDLFGQRAAGRVTEHREVDVEGRHHVAAPAPSEQTPHYYPGGRVAGRPVPEGWYSDPWWKPAMVAGAWGMGSFLLTSALFGGMAGVPAEAAAVDAGGDVSGDSGASGDMGASGMDGDFGGMGDFGF